jgi:predicted O-methyltransferase YrrM
MSARTLGLSDALWQYLVDVTVHEPEVLSELRRETAELPNAGMQISPEQGRLLAFLVELTSAVRCLEVGVFTGYSSLCVALALPPNGRIVACDQSDEWTRIARRYWERAGVAHKVELRLGPGLTTLAALAAEGATGSFDFAFVDADKENAEAYYEHALGLLRQGGVFAFDNALWGGSVADPADQRDSTRAVRALNARVCSDPRVSATLIPVGDGLLVARKR